MAPTALVRPPGRRLAEGLVTHQDRQPVDVDLARRQWDGYCAALAGAGWDLVEVPPADDCPDAVFVEDAAVVFGDLAVACRPGAPERRPEPPAVAEVLAGLGLGVVALSAPATLDGGDVLKVGDRIYVGRGGRTNDEGIAQLRALLEPRGREVVAVPVRSVLHLKSAVTALPDGTVIGHPLLVDSPECFPAVRPVPEESGSHVVVLDERRVLIAADCPATVTELRGDGLEPVVVDIGEFQKLEGCVTCLSVRLRA